ncbi:MAG: TetR/AcrR family transcriptional regulator C-terminal ligand-binding domain-containing protein [Gammaproteobacteria bacterium]|jgi:AcrR family transcriptional regulator|nr:TetR/AcrR family transcriptional regulator C-terminal ligand-binding domain-containing protein [Gammaproteobacteria bacterium]
MPEVTENPRRRPGRPRNPAVRKRVLTAASLLLRQGGLAAVTVEAVAAHSGVGKPTIYRHWPNAQAVAMAALMEFGLEVHEPGSGDPLKALRSQLESVILAFATPTGRSAAALIATADPDTELTRAFRERLLLRSREAGRQLLEQARETGRLDDNLDLEVALDMLYGPLFFRLLFGHQPLRRQLAGRIMDHALRGLATKHPRKK